MASGSRASAPAVSRAIDLLRVLGTVPGAVASLADLARATNGPKSSTLAVLDALVAGGLVRRSEAGYSLGTTALELGGRYLGGIPEVRRFERACIRIPALRRRLVRLAMLDGSDIVYLARHEGDGPVGGAQVGDRLPAASTAMGRVLLAEFSDTIVRGRLESSTAFLQLTARSTRSASSLVTKLRRVRGVGFATEIGEIRPGVVGIGIGLPRTASSPRLAVGVTLPGWTSAAIDHEIVDGLTELAATLTDGDAEHLGLLERSAG